MHESLDLVTWTSKTLSSILFNLCSCTYLKIKGILRQCTYINICKQSTLSQRKNSSNTCCIHCTRVTPFMCAIYRKCLVFISETPAYLRYFGNVYIFHDIKTDFFLLRDCNFTIIDVWRRNFYLLPVTRWNSLVACYLL